MFVFLKLNLKHWKTELGPSQGLPFDVCPGQSLVSVSIHLIINMAMKQANKDVIYESYIYYILSRTHYADLISVGLG